jgi:SAM-dependent methyltransferase
MTDAPAQPPAASAYDDVLYSTYAHTSTHPDRLATIAALSGVTAAPVERCRVLEIGCGSGGNLIPMAATLPHSTFVGCDLAAQPIAAGRALAAGLGLTNLSLQQLDLREFPPAPAPFDYIIAHGVYSWIPEDVRAALLAVVARDLAPRGIAFVSYNALPGCHVRRMAWEILGFHVAGIAEPRTRLAEARALIALVADPANRQLPGNMALQQEFRDLAVRSDGALFHDDLAEVNEPFYFHEFAAAAQAHGLRFLGEAEFTMTADADVAPAVRAAVAGLDVPAREQYLDFVRGRRFRQSLLCHANLAPDRELEPARLAGMSVVAPKLATDRGLVFPAVAPDAGDPTAPAADGLDDARAIVHTITAAWPRPVTVQDLARACRARFPDADDDGPVPRRLAEILVGAYGAGAIELHVHVPPLAAEAGERPVAYEVARAQAAVGSRVTNLWHENVDLDDPCARRLVALCDGTRDRPALVAALGDALPPEEGTAPAAVLGRYLEQLIRLALLKA